MVTPLRISKRSFTIGGVVLLVGLITCLVWLMWGSSGPELPAQSRTVAPVRQDLEETVTAQGKLEPSTYVDVGAQVTGQLKKIHFEIGDPVQQGVLLAEIDPRLYDAQVQIDTARIKNLRAQQRDQEAQLLLARQRLARERELVTTKATSVQIVQESQAAVTSIEARVAALAAQIEELESTLAKNTANLGFTKIHAPISGVVTDLIAREGQTLNANQVAPVILQIADLKTMTVRAQVAEADIPRIKPGMTASFSTLGMLERRWQGVVRQVLPSPEVINEVVLFNVFIDVDNSSGELMKGMTTQIFFSLGSARDALTIPVEALGRRVSDQDVAGAPAYAVKVKGVSGVEERVITVGVRTRTDIAVLSGLSEADLLIITAPQRSGSSSARKSTPGRPGLGGGGPRL